MSRIPTMRHVSLSTTPSRCERLCQSTNSPTPIGEQIFHIPSHCHWHKNKSKRNTTGNNTNNHCTTMRSILLATYAALAGAFAPQQVHHRTSTFRAATKPDMTGDIDIGHAKYCADHFGECSLEEMENIRNGRY